MALSASFLSQSHFHAETCAARPPQKLTGLLSVGEIFMPIYRMPVAVAEALIRLSLPFDFTFEEVRDRFRHLHDIELSGPAPTGPANAQLHQDYQLILDWFYSRRAQSI